MDNQLSWLHLIALENRLRGGLIPIQKKIADTQLEMYSLSDNTMAQCWINHDTEAIFEGVYKENELFFMARLKFNYSCFSESYVNIQLHANGELRFTALLRLTGNEIPMTPMMKVLDEANEHEKCFCHADLGDFLDTLRDASNIMAGTLHRGLDYLTEHNESQVEQIRKFFVGEKK